MTALVPWEATAEEWAGDRIVTKSFLYDILFSEPFSSALINIPINIDGAWLTERVVFSGVTPRNFLALTNSRFDEDFGFQSSSLLSLLQLNGSWARQNLLFVGSRTEAIWMPFARFDGEVNFTYLTSDDPIIFIGAEFSGYVNMSNVIIKFIVLDSPTTWNEGAQISLRGAKISQPAFTAGSWDGLQGKLDLLGLVYDQFTVSAAQLAEVSAGTAAELPLSVLLGWLEMQESRDEIYIPQPYEQLASVLYFMGQDSKADRILYEKNECRRSHVTTSLVDKVWLTTKKYIIGYGYQIWLTLLLFMALICTGAMSLRMTN